jgi:hypothetical protein
VWLSFLLYIDLIVMGEKYAVVLLFGWAPNEINTGN